MRNMKQMFMTIPVEREGIGKGGEEEREGRRGGIPL